MNTVENVKKVSLVFFLVLTGAHLLSSLMLANGYAAKPMTLVNNSLDIPAILAGILYAFTSAKRYLEDIGKDNMTFDITAGVVGGLLVIGSLVLNFFV